MTRAVPINAKIAHLGKMNAHAERFYRTLREAFIDYHEELLISPNQFNRKLLPQAVQAETFSLGFGT